MAIEACGITTFSFDVPLWGGLRPRATQSRAVGSWREIEQRQADQCSQREDEAESSVSQKPAEYSNLRWMGETWAITFREDGPYHVLID